MAITHAIDIKVGFDLTKILSPENIPGVKAYLGVKSDNDLASAILKDKFSQISQLITDGGFNIIDARAQSVTTQEQSFAPQENVEVPEIKEPKQPDEPEETTKTEEEHKEQEPEQEEAPEIKDASNDQELFDKKQAFLKQILKVIKKIKKAQGDIQVIKYSPEIIPYAPSPEEIKHEARMSSEVTIDVEEIDEGLVATISYVDKDGNLKTELLKEEHNG